MESDIFNMNYERVFKFKKIIFFQNFLHRFLVNYLNGISRFRVSLHIMTCFETAASCDQDILVLNNTLLPKSVCNFALGTPLKGILYCRQWFIYFNSLIKSFLLFNQS